jgi:hypothetical protein
MLMKKWILDEGELLPEKRDDFLYLMDERTDVFKSCEQNIGSKGQQKGGEGTKLNLLLFSYSLSW